MFLCFFFLPLKCIDSLLAGLFISRVLFKACKYSHFCLMCLWSRINWFFLCLSDLLSGGCLCEYRNPVCLSLALEVNSRFFNIIKRKSKEA